MLSSLETLLATNNTPDVFTHEHDAILVAAPFSVFAQTMPWAQAHLDRVDEALLRGFLRSARVVDGSLAAACNQSCTSRLSYRLTHGLGDGDVDPPGEESPALLLTCAPNAHLALGNFLERGALFRAEVIGRVTLQVPAGSSVPGSLHPA